MAILNQHYYGINYTHKHLSIWFFYQPLLYMCGKKMINGNQFTIVWYVDENKLLYADPTMIIDLL